MPEKPLEGEMDKVIKTLLSAHATPHSFVTPYNNYSTWSSSSTTMNTTFYPAYTGGSYVPDNSLANATIQVVIPEAAPAAAARPPTKDEDPLVWLRRRVDEVLWDPKAA
jgi:hypothetical protein